MFSREHATQAYTDEQSIIATGIPIIGKEEKETWRGDRDESWVSTTKHPLRDNDGNIIGTFGISRDITVNKNNELELKKNAKQMEHELQMAANLQTAFLPKNYPVFEDSNGKKILEFHHFYQADAKIGGDYFFLHKLNDSEVGVFICDVMGHGVRSAMITAIIKGMIDDVTKLTESQWFCLR